MKRVAWKIDLEIGILIECFRRRPPQVSLHGVRGGRNSARWSESTIIIVSDVYGTYDAGKLR